MANEEKLGWRDARISERHRLYGGDICATDLDFPLVEYNRGEAVALIEYKHAHCNNPNLKHPSHQALGRLAQRSEIPYLVSVYDPDDWSYLVRPGNQKAREDFKTPRYLNERDYVRYLYAIRGLNAPESILEGLCGDPDWWA